MNRPLARLPFRAIATMSPGTRLKWLLILAVAGALGLLAYFLALEMQTSRLQARYLAGIGREVSFMVEPGASNSIRFPSHGGPYDMRLGYARLPDIEQRLRARGYVVTSQARDSSMMTSIVDRGLFVPYAEKDQAGLQLFDSQGELLFDARYPALAYDSFEAIPPIIVSALTFIEDRYLLDIKEPTRNPAIDWGRFSRALSDQALRLVHRGQATPGGSTLATQTEKFRHSPGGRTGSPPEKLRQIASASVRAYLGGENTLPARKIIVMHYLNTVPLAAQPGIGEIQGLGDGVTAWYGRNFDDVNRLLTQASFTTGDALAPAELAAQGLAFKQVLSLIIAQRAPSHYLVRNRAALDRLTDSYLRVLAANGVISPPLRDAALAAPLELHRAAPPAPVESFVARKALTLLRARLQGALGVDSFYDLDRFDLTARATLNNAVQRTVSEGLARATTVDGAKADGLFGFEMLRPGDNPARIAYSFTLFERRNGENLLRVQTDSLNQPFDVNSGARLNLGSTAKLRTIITYLQIVTTLHERYASLSNTELKRVQPDPLDGLTRWALDYLQHTSDRSLPAMLDAAVARKYSASPGEAFYTGGGAQTFTNFDKSDNGRILTVHDAFQHSVNLVFVRLMRDIVHYEMVQAAGPSEHWLDDPQLRRSYLLRFADQESLVYLHRFYVRYHGKRPDEALDTLIADMRKSPPKLATALRSVAPDAPQSWFNARMRAALKGTPAATILDDEDLAKLYAKYGIDKFNLNDRGYIASVHPIELWLLAYLRTHPDASEDEVRKASKDARLTSYAWLFKTRHHLTQDRRIRRMVELQAYDAIGKSWRALGYPFERVTPSFAAAVGASGDRPDALAQLIGIVANDGRMLPPQTIGTLDFAVGTPYETHFAHAATPGRAAVSPEIVDVVHGLLRDVVLGGTGARLATGLPLGNGRVVDVYGKTGTGDQRFDVYARGARLIESRKVNRTATFVFVVDHRFFGTLTAYVHEPYAARYAFTSAMAVQLLKSLGPSLAPLFADDGKAHPSAPPASAQALDASPPSF
ncbi:transglycosylase domain-containing protein [Trinickia fusca]|uniref:peptidoglycan glycosyltransferase n=1 Tax=Trinickia fusca TaxID=2419777 RepID=A0A494XVL8_9BURK|nr:transglycosylase domain-containing protein [Trinickia fusca]RKP52109.1 glycosyl transferase family 51 [Trinickia fusca]